ncbi:hypothetical protein FOXG_12497 [Fusarium oxysporum f. sp. lycopersici 4287]|uniref:Uncharacterized protein n=1 Tax=Fusarium oxysporum f. sp. lycopersici (strain 4287 / CBS 123668 / FGSC 9935 / NRRL 34936) TaxID=426428 RepID=A0A0J9VSJ9_FUSO4|nr:hypothetical protein FOXG_12497 [Fusarium oxysporum f. sp. lycopersici 4287]EWZ79177.1 hypothetical protein FOWG_16628 [Fusarium oxysporum f. sp. lycopersici MN25]KAJ9413065.1 hypothetical protein QL093DRAFT_2090574 [Fusarium oxysporum]KNB13828.1 hypothetical protein FOXG_12497 [Fusarium oxysporum f. sp. lycopersici 4287]
MAPRKRRILMSTGSKVPRDPLTDARIRFVRMITCLEQDPLQRLITITNDLSKNKAAQKEVLDMLMKSTEEKHNGDLSLLSIEYMSDAIRCVACKKEKQQSSTPVRMPKRHSTANTSMQAVRNTHRYETRSQVKRKKPFP